MEKYMTEIQQKRPPKANARLMETLFHAQNKKLRYRVRSLYKKHL